MKHNTSDGAVLYCRAVESSVLKQTTCCTLKPAAPSLSARMRPSYASSVRNTTAA